MALFIPEAKILEYDKILAKWDEKKRVIQADYHAMVAYGIIPRRFIQAKNGKIYWAFNLVSHVTGNIVTFVWKQDIYSSKKNMIIKSIFHGVMAGNAFDDHLTLEINMENTEK